MRLVNVSEQTIDSLAKIAGVNWKGGDTKLICVDATKRSYRHKVSFI